MRTVTEAESSSLDKARLASLDSLDTPDLITVSRAELEAWRIALAQAERMIPNMAGWQSVRRRNAEALAKLEAHLKGQP